MNAESQLKQRGYSVEDTRSWMTSDKVHEGHLLDAIECRRQIHIHQRYSALAHEFYAWQGALELDKLMRLLTQASEVDDALSADEDLDVLICAHEGQLCRDYRRERGVKTQETFRAIIKPDRYDLGAARLSLLYQRYRFLPGQYSPVSGPIPRECFEDAIKRTSQTGTSGADFVRALELELCEVESIDDDCQEQYLSDAEGTTVTVLLQRLFAR